MADGMWQVIGLILGAVGGLFGWLGMWWQRRRRQALEETVGRQEAALNVYAKKEEIRQYDQRQDQAVDERIRRVEQGLAESDDALEQAEVVAGALDSFFSADAPAVRPDGTDSKNRGPADR